MANRKLIPILAILALFMAGIIQPLMADVTGSILGLVTDPSGAAVAGAKVTLTNPDTGLTRHATTDATGSYEFLDVPIGEHYTVAVEASGFERATRSDVKLLVNQEYRADVQLVVGSTTQTVNISAAAVQVESTSTQLGDVIEDKKIVDMPLNGRSYIDLLGLQAGVVPVSAGSASAYGTAVASGDLFNGTLSVSGSRESYNAYMVNGGDVNDSMANGASVVPVLDSIQEFRVLTNSFDAEFGRFSGGLVNVVTKSGTNALHGDVFEFLRNEKMDSRNFFDVNATNVATGQEEPGTAIGEFRQNQFGGTLGGRIIKRPALLFR